jgi:hypothetical protein
MPRVRVANRVRRTQQGTTYDATAGFALSVPGPEIDVSAREHGSRAAGPLMSHSACRHQGAAV